MHPEHQLHAVVQFPTDASTFRSGHQIVAPPPWAQTQTHAPLPSASPQLQAIPHQYPGSEHHQSATQAVVTAPHGHIDSPSEAPKRLTQQQKEQFTRVAQSSRGHFSVPLLQNPATPLAPSQTTNQPNLPSAHAGPASQVPTIVAANRSRARTGEKRKCGSCRLPGHMATSPAKCLKKPDYGTERNSISGQPGQYRDVCTGRKSSNCRIDDPAALRGFMIDARKARDALSGTGK